MSQDIFKRYHLLFGISFRNGMYLIPYHPAVILYDGIVGTAAGSSDGGFHHQIGPSGYDRSQCGIY